MYQLLLLVLPYPTHCEGVYRYHILVIHPFS